jgi:hypothetical protein
LGGEVRRPKVLLWYGYQNGITDEEEDIIFAIKPKLFSIGTICSPKTNQFVKTTYVEIMDTYVNTSISEHGFKVQSIEKKIPGNKYELDIALKDKVFLETYYNH